MKRMLSAILATAAIGLGATLVLGMSPSVEASGPTAFFGKGNRLDTRPIGRDCSERSWPYYEVTCLRDVQNSSGRARSVRIVTTDRIAFEQ